MKRGRGIVAAVLSAALGLAAAPARVRAQGEVAVPAAAASAAASGSASTVPVAVPAPSGSALVVVPAQVVKPGDKSGAITPAVPKRGRTPAFDVYPEIDLPLLGIGLVFAGARLIKTQKAYCAPLCDKNDLNSIDRITAGRYDQNWANVSNYGLYALAIAPAVLLVADEGVLPALNDAAVIAESALFATATASVLTIGLGRPRPFLYGEEAPLDVRNGADASLSFLSSHSAVSFAIATSTYMTYNQLHPTSPWRWVVLGVGLGGASLVATARVMAGRHFITDAVGGAVVGASMGFLVPAMHLPKAVVVPQVSKESQGVAFVGGF